MSDQTNDFWFERASTSQIVFVFFLVPILALIFLLIVSYAVYTGS